MSDIDLSALRLQPVAVPAARAPRGPRVLAAVLAMLAVAVAATFLWPLLNPPRAVPMAPVRAATGAADQPVTTIAEAAGWIEPDPYPVLVRPLVAGRIDAIDVLEGAAVEAGTTVVARLSSAALLAARERADAALAERQREQQRAAAVLQVAERALAQLAEPRRGVDEARVAVAEGEARVALARGAQQRARADAEGASAAATAQQQLAEAGSSYPVALARARAAASAALATAAASEGEVAAVAQELAAAQSALRLAEEVLAAPVELEGAAATARAELAKADAALASAAAEQQIAARELAWTEVTAPASGVVMKLFAAPGAIAGPDHEAILAIYDPAKLRARIDVPLGAVAGVHEGQQVELRSEVLGPMVVRGVVQRVQRESDLLKNTLQVKVQVIDPPPLLRPETLCRARFLEDPRAAGGDAGAGDAAASTRAFVVPRAALRDGTVFRFDPATGRARAVAVTVLREQGDDVVVHGELSIAQRVILVPVTDGDAVTEAAR